MYLIRNKGVSRLDVVWSKNSYAFDPKIPNEFFTVESTPEGIIIPGINEPYFVIQNKDLNIDPKDCSLTYTEYKNICEWDPDLTPNKFPFHYKIIILKAQQCMELRAKHMIVCRQDQDPTHIHAILKNQIIAKRAKELLLTARIPVTMDDTITNTLGEYSIINYKTGPQYSITNQLSSLPSYMISTYIKENTYPRTEDMSQQSLNDHILNNQEDILKFYNYNYRSIENVPRELIYQYLQSHPLNIFKFYNNTYQFLDNISKEKMIYYLIKTNSYGPLLQRSLTQPGLSKFL